MDRRALADRRVLADQQVPADPRFRHSTHRHRNPVDGSSWESCWGTGTAWRPCYQGRSFPPKPSKRWYPARMTKLLGSFALRRVIAFLSIVSGYEKLPERETEWPAYFDNRDGISVVKRELFYKSRSGVLLPFRGDATPLSVTDKIGVEAHITAAEFGTTKKARAFWAGLITSGEIPAELVARFGQTVETQAQRMALHARFWTVPYHWIGLLNGDVLHNNDITRRTYHGDGGNRQLIGVALEGDFPGLESNRKPKHNGYDEHTILTGRAALRLSVVNSRELGAPVEKLRAHRQYDKNRVGDPGQGWWREIGLPMCSELSLTRDVSFKHDSGYGIPLEWDPEGLVDYRGKPISKTSAAA